MKSNKRYLVFCRASNNSLHKEWILPEKYKTFDLFLEYYGERPNHFLGDCDYYSHHKTGAKWSRFPQLIRENKDLIFNYDAVMIADDDISMNASTINNAFEIFMKHDLLLAQPALTRDSYFSHDITRQNINYTLRYTNYVEGMLPIFSQKALKLCWSTFEQSVSGWGLDQIWSSVLGNPPEKIAIIDETPVKHTRAVFNGDLYKTTKVNPWDELETTKRKYGVEHFNPSEYGGVIKLE